MQEAEHAALLRLLLQLLDRAEVDARAPGRATPNRYRAIIRSVNRILFRRSGTLKMFFRLESTAELLRRRDGDR